MSKRNCHLLLVSLKHYAEYCTKADVVRRATDTMLQICSVLNLCSVDLWLNVSRVKKSKGVESGDCEARSLCDLRPIQWFENVMLR